MTLTAAGRLLLGTTTDTGLYQLDVNGTARVSGNTTISGNLTLGAGSVVTIPYQLYVSLIRGISNDPIYLLPENVAAIGVDIAPSFTTADNSISGTRQTVGISLGFNPTSGTAVRNQLSIAPIINQTGTATGISRGIYVNPTLTAAADWRAIESSTGGAYFNTTSVAASAILQADSTTKGFLPPRMTTAQKNAIVSPVAGLQVYDGTLNLPSFYNGTVWVELPISGTYTPTVAVISGGATSVTSNVARYIRVGNVVTVYGVFFYQPSGSGAVETNNEFTITLPITRTVTTNFASGTVSFSTVIGVGEQSQGYLYGTAATTISLYAQNWFSGSGANAFYTFSYEIN